MTGSRRSHTEAAAINLSINQRMADRDRENSKNEDAKQGEDGKCKDKGQREIKMLFYCRREEEYSRWAGSYSDAN